jgi:hypothetical protein
MTTARDSNGKPVYKRVHRNTDGTWSATVWFGHDPATAIRTNTYKTRKQARSADISDGSK